MCVHNVWRDEIIAYDRKDLRPADYVVKTTKSQYVRLWDFFYTFPMRQNNGFSYFFVCYDFDIKLSETTSLEEKCEMDSRYVKWIPWCFEFGVVLSETVSPQAMD